VFQHVHDPNAPNPQAAPAGHQHVVRPHAAAREATGVHRAECRRELRKEGPEQGLRHGLGGLLVRPLRAYREPTVRKGEGRREAWPVQRLYGDSACIAKVIARSEIKKALEIYPTPYTLPSIWYLSA